MAKTSIEWTDHSINPIRARNKATGKVGHYCEKVAAGCANCYSSKMQVRFGTDQFGSGQHRDKYEIFLDKRKLDEVRRRKKPTKYFWCDMTDIFGEWMEREWLEACFATMDATPWHTHILLTKRPDNIRLMWPDRMVEGHPTDYRRNVWLLVSVACQEDADNNIPELFKCRDLVPVLGVSAEPLIGPVTLDSGPRGGPPRFLTKEVDHPEDVALDWVIAGGESGARARPCQVEWIRDITQQCRQASVPCFVKQLGAHIEIANDSFSEWPYDGDTLIYSTEEWEPLQGSPVAVRTKDRKGGNMAEWPEDLRVREFPMP